MAKQMNEVLAALRAVAPERLAEPWDKVGLHVGGADQPVRRALLCIDMTEAVVAEAVKKKCQLVVAYHPPIFAPLTGLLDDGPWTQRRILAAVRAGLTVYSPHTALDAVRGGVCDWLAEVVSAGRAASSVPISPVGVKRDEFKLVVFVPEADEVKLREALSKAGAGGIGRYTECSFSTAGTGGFRPMQGANPAIGQVGRREEVAEKRLEMLVPGASLEGVLAAMRAAHPYEEPAYDVFRLEPDPVPGDLAEGVGRLVTLDQPIRPKLLADRLKKALGVPVKLGHGNVRSVTSIALCPGAGGKLFESVRADAYVTGEMQHHQALDLVQRGAVVALAGHTHTERPYLPVYRQRLIDALGRGVDWAISRADAAPLQTT